VLAVLVTPQVYVGDIFLMDERDLVHTNLSVTEGLGKCTAPATPSSVVVLLCAWRVMVSGKLFVCLAMHADLRIMPGRLLLTCAVCLLPCCCLRAEIVVSVGMALPSSLSAISRRV
jgi:hypothetical protein